MLLFSLISMLHHLSKEFGTLLKPMSFKVPKVEGMEPVVELVEKRQQKSLPKLSMMHVPASSQPLKRIRV